MSGVGGAREQVARLLTLVPLLHVHGQMRLGDAAQTLGVSPEQLLKDLRVLFLVGLPGGYPDDLIDVDLEAIEAEDGAAVAEGMVRVSNAEYLARPLRLTATEATAVIVALRALRETADSETREVVDRALAALEAAAAAGPGAGRVDPGTEDGELALTALADRLRDAAERGRQVRLTYYVPARDERSERVVDPHRVRTHDGVGYLEAWCHSAGAPRLFRLDRVHEARVLDTPVQTEPTEPRDLAAGFFDRAEGLEQVTLRLAPPAHWVTEYYAVESVRPQPDGDVEVDLLISDRRWVTRLLLRLAPHARVVSPVDLADRLAATASAALDLYS
ncbi:helix-turn-helix transcriptional regulator [Nocardioides nanhaiensis]|uniref:WYL domain-containing protein n=1 Tax=Nocardioides nanhaiensis TaxID=1476871 RepID=A0ABP8WM05_9ACTN